MHLNIGHKILGIAIIVLLLMTVVSVFSIRITSEISDELTFIAKKQLPLSDIIGQVNASILEQGILLQQLFVLPHNTTKSIKELQVLTEKINDNFLKANYLIADIENTKYSVETFANFKKTLIDVEKEYNVFEKHSLKLLELHGLKQTDNFLNLLPELNKQQYKIDKEISALRIHVEKVVDVSVSKADKSEYLLLIFHSVMTGIATLLSLGIATWITIALVPQITNTLQSNWSKKPLASL